MPKIHEYTMPATDITICNRAACGLCNKTRCSHSVPTPTYGLLNLEGHCPEDSRIMVKLIAYENLTMDNPNLIFKRERCHG